MLRKKIMSLFKSNRAEDYYKATRVKNVCRGGKNPKKTKTHKKKIQQESDDNTTTDVRK